MPFANKKVYLSEKQLVHLNTFQELSYQINVTTKTILIIDFL